MLEKYWLSGYEVDLLVIMLGWCGFFFSIHFVLPFVIVAMAVLHLLYLHEICSNNSLRINCDIEKVSFHVYYRYKDLVGFIILFFFVSVFGFVYSSVVEGPREFYFCKSFSYSCSYSARVILFVCINYFMIYSQ